MRILVALQMTIVRLLSASLGWILELVARPFTTIQGSRLSSKIHAVFGSRDLLSTDILLIWVDFL